jgi:hypothetical protein
VGVYLVGVLWVRILFVVNGVVGVWFVCCVCWCVMVSLIIGVVCVVVVTLLLVGAPIVEPRLIHYYDVGAVCVACGLSLCVLCGSVSSCTGVGCVVEQGISYSVDFIVMGRVYYSIHRIAVGVFVFIHSVYCACRFASLVVSVVLILFVASVGVVLCFRCAMVGMFVEGVVISVTN